MKFPSVSVHNSHAWNDKCSDDTRVIGVMFAGKTKSGADDAVFIGINAHWEQQSVQLPDLPGGMDWNIRFYTNCLHQKKQDYNPLTPRKQNQVYLAPRSVVIAEVTSSPA